jgi:molybdate transport system substrate-binding protein
MQQKSEIMAVPGVVLVGPIPLHVQNFTIYSGAISTATQNRAAADALMQALADPQNQPILNKRGLDEP